MYQSIPIITIPPANFQKSQIPPPAKYFGKIPGAGLPSNTLFLQILQLFAIFKTSIINLLIEYLQIRKENINLSIKNMQKPF